MSGSKSFGPDKDFPSLTEPSGKPMLRKYSTSELAGSLTPLSFIELSDTPSSYSSQTGKVVMVNPTSSGVYFVDFDHDDLLNTHNLTTDIDHDQLLNYVEEQHIRWDVPGTDKIDPDRLPDISDPDDDFYNTLTLVTSIEDNDQLLIADASDFYSYKRITRANLVDGLGTVQNAYYRIIADAGTANLDADGEDTIYIKGDGDIIETIGDATGINELNLVFIQQTRNLVLAGPPSGASLIPTFRSLVDADMPDTYNSSDWDTAYTHSLSTGNPHSTSHGDLADLSADDHAIYALLSGRTGDVLLIDEINEYTTDAGVTIEGVLIKDSEIDWSYISNVPDITVFPLKNNDDSYPTPAASFGDGDTFLRESADDVLDLYVGNQLMIRFDASSWGIHLMNDYGIRFYDTDGTTQVGYIYPFSDDIYIVADNTVYIEGNELQLGTTTDLRITGDIILDNGAVSGYYLKCTDSIGTAEWAPITASQTYKGTWDADTNDPTLANGTGTAGDYYRVIEAGTQDLGSGDIVFSVGDDVIYDGSVWERIPGSVIVGNALTKTDDTNVTLTLDGSHATALVNAASITVGWTGTLADDRITSASNWNTAYNWGDHAGLYSLIDHDHDSDYAAIGHDHSGIYEPAITAGTTAQYWRGDKSWQTLNTTIVSEGTNLYFTSTRVATHADVSANTAARHNAVTIGTPANGLSLSTQELSIVTANSLRTGALSYTDWNSFNNKVSFPGFDTLANDYGFTDNSANWNTAYGWGDHAGLYSLTSHNHSGVYEPVLGNPSVNGYLLSSTTAGVRSWIAPGGVTVDGNEGEIPYVDSDGNGFDYSSGLSYDGSILTVDGNIQGSLVKCENSNGKVTMTGVVGSGNGDGRPKGGSITTGVGENLTISPHGTWSPGSENNTKISMLYRRSGSHGYYYSALEYSDVGTGFSNLLLMKSGGNVGIGTSSPVYKLDIRDNSSDDTILNLSHSDLNSYIRFNNTFVAGYYDYDDRWIISRGTLITTTTPAISIGSNNHVCIGGTTNSSTYEFSVVGDSYLDGDVVLPDIATGSEAYLTIGNTGVLSTRAFPEGEHNVEDIRVNYTEVINGSGLQTVIYSVGCTNAKYIDDPGNILWRMTGIIYRVLDGVIGHGSAYLGIRLGSNTFGNGVYMNIGSQLSSFHFEIIFGARTTSVSQISIKVITSEGNVETFHNTTVIHGAGSDINLFWDDSETDNHIYLGHVITERLVSI
jgi:hypothetical protein